MNKSDFIIVYNGDYAGLQTKSGRVVLPCEYDDILDYDDDGYVRFIKNKIYGTVDLQGNVCIPLSAKLTHLGVFHKGTARARIDDKWGLVDVNGKHITDFVYKSINAHRKYGYSVVTLDDRKGILTENGVFKEKVEIDTNKRIYSLIAPYRNGIAPAQIKNHNWVFIDENQNRINDIEYWTLSYLCKNVYLVAKNEHSYTIADYQGVPLTEDRFVRPLEFYKGLAVCCINRFDDYKDYYGVINLQGKYIFKPIYSVIHWNNPLKKDSWFAEDDEWAYLLFPDGTRKVYDKSYISYDKEKHIAEWNLDKYINAEDEFLNYRPQLISSYKYSLFNEEKFKTDLLPWLGRSYSSLNFFYRDTDAEIDVDKLYKRGYYVRTDSPLIVSQSLMRPVHRIRFLIAAYRFLSLDSYSNNRRSNDTHNIHDYMIPSESNFLVVDVQKFGNQRQVVLLHIPHAAMLIAKQYKINILKFRPLDYYQRELHEGAAYNFMDLLDEDVHGHSLDEEWCNAMYQPVGCNKELKLNELIMNPYSFEDYYKVEERSNLRFLGDCDDKWDSTEYIEKQHNTISVFKGDITKRIADVMINFVRNSESDEDSFKHRFRGNTGKALYDECKKYLNNESGAFCFTDSYNYPYKKILHIRLTTEPNNKKEYLKELRTSLNKALKEIEKTDIKKIILPAVSFLEKDEVKTVTDVMVNHLKKGLYHGDFEIFADTEEESQEYKSYLDKINDKGINFVL